MRALHKILGGELFRIDETACSEAAKMIRRYRGDQVTAPWSKSSKDTQLVFKLAFVSICHQINWDFLQLKLAENLLTVDSPLDILQALSSVTYRDIEVWLGDYQKPERIRSKERAKLLRNIGEVFLAKFSGDVKQFLNQSEGFISGSSGFLSQLDHFAAYREDPLRKKSNVLLQELTREGIANFSDENAISAAVDYHIMRIFLRTGRVVPTTLEVQEQLKREWSPRLRVVQVLRENVSTALALTAFYADLPVSEVNYIEWQLGRAVCLTDIPACTSKVRDPDLDETVAQLFAGYCPYTGFCEAYANSDWRIIQEPHSKKSFY